MKTFERTDRHPVRVNDREQLIYLLTEAAEIEHGLMCTYLYALWSLKRGEDEGIDARQLAVIDNWRGVIRSVALEEMAHLATVNNLLMSIGSPPHFRRQNFPVPPGYHPASLVARLAPLDRDTMHHFVYLERPEGMTMQQAAGFETAVSYERAAPRTMLTPTAEDYDTVGRLYRGIEEGFLSLGESLGEQALFIGHPGAQLDRADLDLDGLLPVRDLASALAAIGGIVEQGEGGRNDSELSHFARFTAMAREYDALLAADPAFVPHRPVAADPVMLPPLGGAAVNHVEAPEASRMLDVANASYGLMLRLLASGTGVAKAGEPMRGILLGAAISLMHVIGKLAVALTTLPAGPSGAATAGMNFHLPRSGLALPQREAGAALMAERASEIGRALAGLARVHPQLTGLAGKLSEIADQLKA